MEKKCLKQSRHSTIAFKETDMSRIKYVKIYCHFNNAHDNEKRNELKSSPNEKLSHEIVFIVFFLRRLLNKNISRIKHPV